MVGLSAKRSAVGYLQEQYQVSKRRACKVIAIDRSSKRRGSGRPRNPELVKGVWAESLRFPRFGCRKIWQRLKLAGWRVARETVRLIRRPEFTGFAAETASAWCK